MSIFDGIIRIDDEGNIIYNKWIEWEHYLIVNKPDWLRQILRAIAALVGHCMTCTVLDGCYFVERIMPTMYPEGLIKNTTPFGGWIK